MSGTTAIADLERWLPSVQVDFHLCALPTPSFLLYFSTGADDRGGGDLGSKGARCRFFLYLEKNNNLWQDVNYHTVTTAAIKSSRLINQTRKQDQESLDEQGQIWTSYYNIMVMSPLQYPYESNLTYSSQARSIRKQGLNKTHGKTPVIVWAPIQTQNSYFRILLAWDEYLQAWYNTSIVLY